MMTKEKLPANLAEAFEYLDELRESGETNMFGARPYLVRDLGYDGGVAAVVLSAWMETFDNARPAEKRAKQAYAAVA